METPDPNAITVLLAGARQPARKTFGLSDDGSLASEDYPLIKQWHVRQATASTIVELAAVVEKAAKAKRAIIISGEPSREIDADEPVFRRYLGDTADFKEVPRNWVALDIDDCTVPAGTREEMVGYLLDRLPPALGKADVAYQWSSKQEVHRPANQLRVRLWFLLDRPVFPSYWRKFARRLAADGIPVDPALYNPVQPHYVAPPAFRDGLLDPFASSKRIGCLRQAGPVQVDDIQHELGPPEKADVVSSDVTGSEAQIAAVIDRLSKQTTTGARHHHALGAACELVAIGCDEGRVIEAVEEIIVRQGREPQEREAENAYAFATKKRDSGELRCTTKPLSEVFPEGEEVEGLDSFEAGAASAGADEAWATLEDSFADVELTESEPVAYDPEAGSQYNAEVFFRRQFPAGGYMHWSGADYEWTGKLWKEVEANKKFDTLALRMVKDSPYSYREACGYAQTLRGLYGKEGLKVNKSISNPEEDIGVRFMFTNGSLPLDSFLFDPETKLEAHNKDLFVQHTLTFGYDREAKCPRWLKHMDDCFADDEESKRELQKMFGYVLSGRAELQKFFVLQGPPRAGKGVVTQILTDMLGKRAVASKMMSDFSDDFFYEGVWDKPLLLIPEANAGTFKRGAGASTANKLTQIVGQDIVNVRRKAKTDICSVEIPCRIVASCNRLPGFIDPSGALLARMILLRFRQSFIGREDYDLLSKLRAELPGIFNWALEGARILAIEDGRFIQPQFSVRFLETLKDCMSPTGDFMSEAVELDSGAATPTMHVYDAYREWTRANGNATRSRSHFEAEVIQTFPSVDIAKTRKAGETRPKAFLGLKLTDAGKALMSGIQSFEGAEE